MLRFASIFLMAIAIFDISSSYAASKDKKTEGIVNTRAGGFGKLLKCGRTLKQIENRTHLKKRFSKPEIESAARRLETFLAGLIAEGKPLRPPQKAPKEDKEEGRIRVVVNDLKWNPEFYERLSPHAQAMVAILRMNFEWAFGSFFMRRGSAPKKPSKKYLEREAVSLAILKSYLTKWVEFSNRHGLKPEVSNESVIGRSMLKVAGENEFLKSLSREDPIAIYFAHLVNLSPRSGTTFSPENQSGAGLDAAEVAPTVEEEIARVLNREEKQYLRLNWKSAPVDSTRYFVENKLYKRLDIFDFMKDLTLIAPQTARRILSHPEVDRWIRDKGLTDQKDELLR